MLSYHEYEEKVYQWLIEKRAKTPGFNFSLRKNAKKNAKTDYFLGTKKSGYFSTTFWTIPVGYPGSSGELISLIFRYRGNGYSYVFEFNHTKSPYNEQNESALELIRSVKPIIKNDIGLSKESPEKSKHEKFMAQAKSPYFEDIGDMFDAIEKELNIVLQIVNKAIEEEKQSNPDFIAHSIDDLEFKNFEKHLERRKLTYKKADDDNDKIEYEEEDDESLSPPLNQILFGPPGTGKTYHTVNKAIEIVNPDFDLDQDRVIVKEEFDRLLEAGRVVFTTFHQSMSYEDFIEGIKPNLDNDEDDVSYKIEDGIFKKICIDAGYEYIRKQPSDAAILKAMSYDQLYDKFLSSLEERLDNETEVQLPLKSGSEIIVTEITAKSNLKLKHVNGNRSYTVSKRRMEKLFDEIDDLSAISNLNEYFRKIIGGSNVSAYWAILNQLYELSSNAGIEKNTLDVTDEEKQKAFKHLKWNEIDSSVKVPHYVLIIDEINRGNVSSIFGELITLIEEDKRGGKPEALIAKLPYSKKNFSVPANLHIIGTMNTADRSVEALDTALRRRFSFEERLPNPALIATEGILSEEDGIVDDISLPDLLEVINSRIEKLLDKDYLIGHSYFMKVDSLEELQTVFQNEIIPLLQEYFYGNFGKIELIIGKSFFEQSAKAFTGFAESDYEGKEDYLDRKVYRLKDIENMDLDEFAKAIQEIYQYT